MDPRQRNVRKDPFGQSVTRPVGNQTIVEQPSTPTPSFNPPPSGIKQPITNKNLGNSQPKFTPSAEMENKIDDQALKEYNVLKVYNSSKNFIGTTCEKFPANSGILKDASFPIGMILNPYCNYENELPLINYGEKEIPRCISSTCRAYINPFIKWIQGGEKWICNICGFINDTADYYYSRLDKNDNRIDREEKPDINCGSYEFIANSTYMKKDRPVAQPVYIFIIDVSYASYQNGFLSAVLETLKELIKSEAFTNLDKVKVGLITYDSSVNFYCMNEKQTQPLMLCVGEDEVFLPCPFNNLIVNPVTSKTILMNTLELIQSSSGNNTCKDSSKIFNAITAGYLIAKNTGAKLIVFNSSSSMIQLPKMKSNKISNIPKEELIYTPTDDRQLSTMGVNMTNENISCDIFLTSENYVNLITLNQLCDNTNGNLYLYKNFRLETHYKNLFNQLRRVATRPMCLETVIRTRFSKGYKISNFITPVLISNNDLIVCPTLDSDQTFTFGLEMTEQNPGNNQVMDGRNTPNINDAFVFIQTAILYTHQDNTRRIRVHNLCLPLAHRLVDLYESIDSDNLAAYYTKLTIDRIFKTKKIANSVLASEASYKAFISSVMATLLRKELPQNLMYLPLYFLGMIKHRVSCKDELERKLDVDLSNYFRIKLQKLCVNDIMSFIYPKIFAIHQILLDNTIGNIDENGVVALPQTVNTHKGSLESDGVFLIDNGFLLILYISNNCNRNLFSSIFKVNDVSEISGPLLEDNLFVEPDENLQRIINIIDYIRGTKAIFQNLIFVLEGTDAERIVKESLIEDNFCPWVKLDFKTFYMNTVESNTGGYRQGLR